MTLLENCFLNQFWTLESAKNDDDDDDDDYNDEDDDEDYNDDDNDYDVFSSFLP